MLGLTNLGIFHTAVSLVAVIAGLIALIRDKAITGKNPIGKVYVINTVISCLTGFGIYQHGGFGKPHILGILTLLVLIVAGLAGRGTVFGRASAAVETVSYSLTFFFHMIPGMTETTTRFPLDAPLIPDRESPILQMAAGIFFLLFLIGATFQVRHLRRASPAPFTPSLASE